VAAELRAVTVGQLRQARLDAQQQLGHVASRRLDDP
jgi:hypothetical protein